MTESSKILTFQCEYDGPRDIPEGISMADYVLDAIRAYGNDEACVNSETKQRYTYADIIQLTEALAAGMRIKWNVSPGDRVMILLPVCMEYPIATMAVHLCGATGVLANPLHTVAELKHAIGLTNPIKLWIGDEVLLTKFHQLYPDEAQRPPFVVRDGPSWTDLIALGKGQTIERPVVNTKEDVAFIFFSSGTTGLPKGVMLTHANCIAARILNAEMLKDYTRSDDLVNCIMLPLYHTAGYTTMIDSFVVGVRCVVIPTLTFPKVLQAIQEFKISNLTVVPPIAVELAKQPVEKMFNLSSLKVIRSGSGPVGKETILTIEKKLNCHYFMVYGMTETTAITHANTIKYNKAGSIGVTRLFCETKVVDLDTNEALGPNKVGEICIRGALVTKGYIGNEEATRNTIDADGWLHTGDIGYYDEDGFFFITDRLKELIKYKGFQVSPTELEQILLSHPAVLEAAVSSVPDDEAGELPRAFIVRRPGAQVTEEELAKLVADTVSGYKRLRGGVIFLDSIPKNNTGKILRRDLKNWSPSP